MNQVAICLEFFKVCASSMPRVGFLFSFRDADVNTESQALAMQDESCLTMNGFLPGHVPTVPK
jgi:hypothetical protein